MLNWKVVKSPIFCVNSFAAIAFVIYAGSLIFNHSANLVDITACRTYKAPHNPSDVSEAQQIAAKAPEQIKENTTGSTPLLNKQATSEEEEDSEKPDPMVPPPNLRGEEKRKWIRKTVPELEILKSNDSGQRFNGRVMEFFNQQCTIQFFMIWFSPAGKFGPREFLSVDSLLKSNPQACLMILSKSLDTIRGYKILKPFLDRELKVFAVTTDVPFLVKNTPAEVWLEDIKSGKLDPGTISFTIHLSDLVRMAILYKYGGVYLDTDFLVLKNFEGLRNAIGVQIIDRASKNWKSVNNALQIFDIWHPMLFQFIKEYATNFKPNIWGENGPYLLSRIIKRLDAGRSPVYNISVLPRKAFYPVDWLHISRLYKKPTTEEESKWAEETVAELSRESYAIHLWNQISRPLVIEEGSVIERLIASHCLICQKVL
ncbi:uncharacterized protein At4g19900-like [Pistacia vera]|uniref:uncharacterized protein At4g19900-like n=1 Tax=Pistacia vera TaxID=55513 RepID=UPI001262E07B|nr:uncharacterized protein At4g19900-like [Pistacia vera]